MDFEKPSLIKFQIGPVQDFIAQARSTRDLWSGSYLLSFLVASGIREMVDGGGNLIFPNTENQPLLPEPNIPLQKKREDLEKLLTPNLPNLFIAKVPEDKAEALAKAVEKKMRDRWQQIADACWTELLKNEIVETVLKSRYDAQVASHLSISWQITPLTKNYAGSYQKNGWHLDSVRQTRDFKAWLPTEGGNEKDSLGGIAEALCGGTDFQKRMAAHKNDFTALFKHSDHLGAVTLIKRVWHLAYLGIDSKSFRIRSTRAIAARTEKLDDEENTDAATGEKYLAAIAFDGDSIGKWISGEYIEADKLGKFHSDFSEALSDFALQQVRGIVQKIVPLGGDGNIPLGFLVYAGGDDVVALVPADVALDVAEKIRKAFQVATKSIRGLTEGKEIVVPDGSAGIAIAHFKAPLQDLIRQAQAAEKTAKRDPEKGGYGRSAFSITLMKRSGEISHWGAKWGSGAITLHDEIFAAMKDRKLSAKFPHRVCQLLEPYLTRRTGISKQQDAVDFDAHAIIEKEFLHAATRQGSADIAELILPSLKAYLKSLGTEPQTLLKAILGLCQTLAFTFRNLPETPTPVERQLVS